MRITVTVMIIYSLLGRNDDGREHVLQIVLRTHELSLREKDKNEIINRIDNEHQPRE